MDKPALSAVREKLAAAKDNQQEAANQLAAAKENHDEACSRLATILQAIDEEIAREPTVADVQALLSEVVARQKPAA